MFLIRKKLTNNICMAFIYKFNLSQSVQLLSHVWLFETPWTAAYQASLSSTISQSLLKFRPIESVIISNHLILCCPLLLVCVLSHFSHVQLFGTLWIVAHQASLSMGFSRQNTGVGCHFFLQGIFPTQVFSQTSDWTHVSYVCCTGKWVLYY